MAYYSLTAPSEKQWIIPQLFSPLLPYPQDRTYGRSSLPISPAEERIRKEFKFRCGVVLLKGVQGGESGEVAYNVWMPKGEGNGKDLGEFVFLRTCKMSLSCLLCLPIQSFVMVSMIMEPSFQSTRRHSLMRGIELSLPIYLQWEEVSEFIVI